MSDAADLCAYVNASPSPFHAVLETKRRLIAAGFSELAEEDDWALVRSGTYFVVRGDSSVIAFRMGRAGDHAHAFRLIGAHTDSPNLRLKPNPGSGREGYAQLGIEVYGGVLLHTWLDRDLGLAGRLITESHGVLERHMVRRDVPIARIPSLAIHLDRDVNDKGLLLNKQQHLPPVLGLGEGSGTWNVLLKELAAEVGSTVEQVRGFDLGLYDLTLASLGGVQKEFVFAARLDNLASCHAAVCALIAANNDCSNTQVIALFDHEEVGSGSIQGAAGPFLEDVLRRLIPSGFSQAMARSFCVSADMAHAVHPNYVDRHEPRHMPRIGHGPVVKANVQQRYATDGLTSARFRQACGRAGVVPQDFVTRTDLACGSTIGPITATRLGVATVDVGNPMLSMHSAREMCGSADVAPMIAVMQAVLSE